MITYCLKWRRVLVNNGLSTPSAFRGRRYKKVVRYRLYYRQPDDCLHSFQNLTKRQFRLAVAYLGVDVVGFSLEFDQDVELRALCLNRVEDAVSLARAERPAAVDRDEP